MKQADRLSRSGIDRRNVRAFITIAEDAAIGQIAGSRSASVFPADNVIDLMSEGGPAFGVETVLATMFGANNDLLP